MTDQTPLGALPPPPPGATPQPVAPPQPSRPYLPGTNGLAIAALVCGIVGLFVISAILAVIFGIVALNQLRERAQSGRGLAITGIVLGSLWLVGWAALIVVGLATAEPERNAAGEVISASTVTVDTLRAGDCFDGISKDAEGLGSLDEVTVKPCTSPHQAQVGTIVTLPEGGFPGKDKAADIAGTTCEDKLEPLMRDEAFDQVDLYILYPDSSFAWRSDRSAICVLTARDDTVTGSALT